MQIGKSVSLFLNYCCSKQLRERSIHTYEQALNLFVCWLDESEGIDSVEQIGEMTICNYVLHLQERGKYTVAVNERSGDVNHPENRRDYMAQISSTTINNYLRSIRAYMNWLVEVEVIAKSPMRRIKLLKQQRKPRDFMSDTEVKELILNTAVEKKKANR